MGEGFNNVSENQTTEESNDKFRFESSDKLKAYIEYKKQEANTIEKNINLLKGKIGLEMDKLSSINEHIDELEKNYNAAVGEKILNPGKK